MNFLNNILYLYIIKNKIMAYTINFHWSGKNEFTNGWQLLWYGKFNQDEAKKERNGYYMK